MNDSEASIFDLTFQNDDVESKISAGWRRISMIFRAMLWEQATKYQLSPLQLRILIFLHFHKES